MLSFLVFVFATATYAQQGKDMKTLDGMTIIFLATISFCVAFTLGGIIYLLVYHYRYMMSSISSLKKRLSDLKWEHDEAFNVLVVLKQTTPSSVWKSPKKNFDKINTSEMGG
jgi:predicted membrane protein